jgi:hypothetical protein
MTDLWKQFAGDFNSMTDEEIDHEANYCRDQIEENEAWLEAVASWEAAGKPRSVGGAL